MFISKTKTKMKSKNKKNDGKCGGAELNWFVDLIWHLWLEFFLLFFAYFTLNKFMSWTSYALFERSFLVCSILLCDMLSETVYISFLREKKSFLQLLPLQFIHAIVFIHLISHTKTIRRYYNHLQVNTNQIRHLYRITINAVLCSLFSLYVTRF